MARPTRRCPLAVLGRRAVRRCDAAVADRATSRARSRSPTPDRVTRVLSAAGFRDIEVEPHDVVMRAPDEPDAVAEWLIELGPASAAYRAAAPSDQAAARAGTARLLERFREAGIGYSFPSGIWLLTAVA